MPPIDRHAYSDSSVFDDELQRLFFRRMFAGTQFDFEPGNNYRSLEIGKKAVTIRRLKNDIHCYGNVCLHRNSLIDPQGYGDRPFRCRYHGWSYSEDGSLADAPLADHACIKVRALPTYPTSESHGLHFLGLSGAAPEVDGIDKTLDQAQIVIDRPFHRETLQHACNWKFLVENVLEGYHLSFVHGETFRPAGFTSTGTYAWADNASTSWNLLTPAPAHDKNSAMQRLSRNAGHFYSHAYIFPDLFLSNTNGLVGFLSHVLPKSASSTHLDWMLFELPALKALPAPIRAHIKNEAIQFTQAALKEDQVLVEACHVGTAHDGPLAQLQPCEGRIAHFHSLYRNWMQHV